MNAPPTHANNPIPGLLATLLLADLSRFPEPPSAAEPAKPRVHRPPGTPKRGSRKAAKRRDGKRSPKGRPRGGAVADARTGEEEQVTRIEVNGKYVYRADFPIAVGDKVLLPTTSWLAKEKGPTWVGVVTKLNPSWLGHAEKAIQRIDSETRCNP